MPSAPQVTVVLPTYKEEGAIGATLDDLARAMKSAGIDWEAVVVDDDSPDGTHQEVQDAAARYEGRVRLIVRTDERGLASAVVRGFHEANGTTIAVMDADGQHPAEAVARMVQEAEREQADVVVGTRHREGGSVGTFGPLRRFVSWGATMMAKLALPPVRKGKVSDPMSGLFLVHRDAIQSVDMDPRGYKILLEVLAKARPRGKKLVVREVPYTFQSRRAGDSKLGASVMVDYLLHLAALGWKDRENRRFVKFGLVGASGILVNLLFVWIGGHFFGATGGTTGTASGRPSLQDLGALLVSGAVARELSVGWNFLANDVFTFHDKRHLTGHGMFMRFIKFNVVSFASFLVYVGILVGLAYLGLHYLLAAFIAIVAGFLINFKANVDWTYRENGGGAKAAVAQGDPRG